MKIKVMKRNYEEIKLNHVQGVHYEPDKLTIYYFESKDTIYMGKIAKKSINVHEILTYLIESS